MNRGFITLNVSINITTLTKSNHIFMAIRGKNSDSRDQFQKRSDSVWRVLNSVPQPSEDLETRVISNTIEDQSTDYHTTLSFSWIYRVAAAVLLMISAGIWFYYSTQDDVPVVTSVSYESMFYTTERGERIEIQLTDHIYVQLNTETKLQIVPNNDKLDPRLVYLSGEAYFSISKVPERFEVLTDAGVVQVIGTAFNVHARDEEVEVAVETGVVALRSLPDEDIDTIVQIPAGHRSLKQKNTPALEPSPIDIDKYLSWRKGRFVFEQTPLSDVIRNLERAYNVRIDLHGATLEDIRVTGEFGQEPLMQILNEICWSANLRYRQEENIYILYQPE